MEKKIFLDTVLASYSNLLLPSEAKKLLGLITKDNDYSIALFNLVADWRSISNSQPFPFFSMQSLEGFDKGSRSVVLTRDDATFYTEKIIKKVLDKIERNGKIPVYIRNILKTEFKAITHKITIARKEAEEYYRFPVDDVWIDFINQYEYKTAIWGLTRLCFLSIYNSYEYFLVDTLRKKLRNNNIRTTNRNFDAEVIKALGKGSLESVWKSNDLLFIRNVRNCLAHNGGIATDLSKKFPKRVYNVTKENYRIDEHTKNGSCIPLCEGEIQITPLTNKWAVIALSSAVDYILKNITLK